MPRSKLEPEGHVHGPDCNHEHSHAVQEPYRCAEPKPGRMLLWQWSQV